MCDAKRQIQFKGARHNTINVKNTKFDVNVSEVQTQLTFMADFNLGARTFKVRFYPGECLITETTERQKYL